MIELKHYIVTKEVAQLCGNLNVLYRTIDGRFIVNSRTLKNVYKETWADCIEEVSLSKAKEAIRRGGYKRGEN